MSGAARLADLGEVVGRLCQTPPVRPRDDLRVHLEVLDLTPAASPVPNVCTASATIWSENAAINTLTWSCCDHRKDPTNRLPGTRQHVTGGAALALSRKSVR